jgi:hypothetical protein
MQGVAARAPPDPIEMSRLEQQAEGFEQLLKQDPNDLQVRTNQSFLVTHVAKKLERFM